MFLNLYFTVVKELESSLSDVELFASGGGDSTKSLIQDDSSIVDLDMEIVNSSFEAVPQSVQTCTNFNDKLLYIFTSGTTGLPKAAVIKNSRQVHRVPQCTLTFQISTRGESLIFIASWIIKTISHI